MTPERIGPYPIEREVGRGGMGVVYLGRDTRLERRVAIKVLTDAFAADPDRLARFEREAKIVASLNHPNIAGIYGLEEANGRRFLALEYVEGPTLAERVAHGPLPLDEALDVCRQVAAALEAAHEGGVVHRDLKPGNVKITPSGEVKVLDFGLAKGNVGSTTDSSSDLSHSPTMTQAATGVGVILGTAAYMSPEQARGRPVDKRADIWAFGCLLYECLTGRQAFAGETVSDMIARILQGEPEWNALPARTPERIRGLLRRCLEKDVRRRLRDIGDAKIEIEDVLAVRASSSSLTAAAAARPRRMMLSGARMGGVAVAAAAVTWFLPRAFQEPARIEPARFEVPQPQGMLLEGDAQACAISPDGRFLAFIASDSAGNGRLWLRPLESTTARPIAGAEKPDRGIFWSPDSRQIAFASEEKLKRIPVDGGDAEIVCPVKGARGGSWNRDGVILVAPTSNGAIFRVPASGGEPQPVTTLDSTRHETAHRFPQFLPDGRHFLYSVLPAREGKFDIYVGSLDSPKRRRLMTAETGVTVAPGRLIYGRNGKLMAQAFDPGSARVRGEPVSLGDLPGPTFMSGGPVTSAAANGTLAYRTFRLPNVRLAWLDRLGREKAAVPLAPGPYALGTLSPDDRRLAIARFESADQIDVWIVDLERGVATRFTDEEGNNASPTWSPDGSRIAYSWENGGPQVLKVKRMGGEPPESFLESDPLFKRFYGWTPDGHAFVFGRQDPATQWDLWVLPMDGDRTPRPYLRTRFSESSAQLSPDGRWLAYQCDKSGRFEAYVQSFPTPGLEYQVTTSGGQHAGWSADGKQLYYVLNSDPYTLFEADVVSGAEFRLGPPRVAARLPKDLQDARPAHDGTRFLAMLTAGQEPTASITVVLNGLQAVHAP